MRTLPRSLLLGMAASLLLSACATPQNSHQTKTLSLISFNDFHGNLLPAGATVSVKDSVTGQAAKAPAGGAAYLASLIKQLKAENPDNTLIVASGDLVGASPQVSAMFHDEPTVDILNAIGVSYSTVGNHEFDKGKDELLRLQNGGCFPLSADHKRGVVGVDTCLNQGKFAGAHYRYLAANVIDQSTGKTLLPAYAIQNIGGIRIGLIGAVLKETPAAVTPSGVAGLRFEDEISAINALIPKIKQEGANIIVVLLHQGAATQAKTINDTSCPSFSGEALRIADGLDPAVEVVISGHTHEEYACRRPDGKLLTQAGNYGRMVSKIDLQIDTNTGKVLQKQARNYVNVNDSIVNDANKQPLPLPNGYTRLVKDPAIDAQLQPYVKLIEVQAAQVAGQIDAPLDRNANDAGESTLGDVLADAYLFGSTGSAYGNQAAQIAFLNPGGIRSNLNQGLAITYGQLYSVHPFGNNLVTLDLTGEQIRRMLEQQWEQPQPAPGRVLPVSSGFSYSWDASKPAGAAPGMGQRVVAGSMKLNGVAIEANKTYRVTVNNFMAAGGDNFTVLTQGKNRQEGEIDIDVLNAYFKSKPVIERPALKRIQRLN